MKGYRYTMSANSRKQINKVRDIARRCPLRYIKLAVSYYYLRKGLDCFSSPIVVAGP